MLKKHAFVPSFVLDYSQVLDDAPRRQAFPKNNVLKPEIQNALLHKSKRGSWTL